MGYKNILDEAIEITSGPRRRDYDTARANHERIARMWQAYLDIRKDPKGCLSAADACHMMILLKIVRNTHTPKRDNRVDIAGYARCLDEIQDDTQEPLPLRDGTCQS